MILVIGIGNPDRGDDAAGVLVARRVRAAASRRDVSVREVVGDQLALLDTWCGARTVYVVDAIRSGKAAGSVCRFDAAEPLDAPFWHRGTHTFSLADVIELGRALGRLPGRLLGYGIEGTAFGLGDPVSPGVEAAVAEVADEIIRLAKEGD
jgi:hydrogenase maturation protease